MKTNIKFTTQYHTMMTKYINTLSSKTQNLSTLLNSYISYCQKKLNQKQLSNSGKKRLKFISERTSNNPKDIVPNSPLRNEQGRIVKHPRITGKVFKIHCVKDGKIINGYRLLMKYNKLKFYFGPYEDQTLVKVMNSAIQKNIRTLRCSQENYSGLIRDCVKEIKKAFNLNYTMLTMFKSSKLRNKKPLKKIGHLSKEKEKDKEDMGNVKGEMDIEGEDKENKEKTIGDQYMNQGMINQEEGGDNEDEDEEEDVNEDEDNEQEGNEGEDNDDNELDDNNNNNDDEL